MNYPPFNRQTVIAMEAFLSDFQKPFCFVGKIIFNKKKISIVSNLDFSS
jgi:hypothetical protein